MWPSTRVALLGTIVSLVLESMAEATVSRSRIFGCGPTSFLVVLPTALPGIVTRLVLRSGSRNSRARGAMLAVALSASSPSW